MKMRPLKLKPLTPTPDEFKWHEGRYTFALVGKWSNSVHAVFTISTGDMAEALCRAKKLHKEYESLYDDSGYKLMVVDTEGEGQ
jgi:hypothetical protein